MTARELLDLDALGALAAAATVGPWKSEEDGLVWAPRLGDPVSGSVELDDARFIAAARLALPDLVAEVRALRAEVDQLRQSGKQLIDFRNGVVGERNALAERVRNVRALVDDTNDDAMSVADVAEALGAPLPAESRPAVAS